jgi:hypothetical protein
MSHPIKPLGIVRELVQSIGFDISYAYDDLVFSDHSIFILRFDDTYPDNLYLYFNSDCNVAEADTIRKQIIPAGKIMGLHITSTGLFKAEQREGKEEIEINFYAADPQPTALKT